MPRTYKTWPASIQKNRVSKQTNKAREIRAFLFNSGIPTSQITVWFTIQWPALLLAKQAFLFADRSFISIKKDMNTSIT